MNELLKYDKDFNEGMFITKANNIFIMLHTGIMMNDLDRVRHFISEELEDKYDSFLDELNKKDLTKMYDELNVKTNTITNISIDGNKAIINVDIVSRYMEYYINKSSGDYVSGNNSSRVEKMNHLIFEKNINSSYDNVARKCLGCGANISVNTNGKCSYCGRIFDAENYDWILTSIDTIDV